MLLININSKRILVKNFRFSIYLNKNVGVSIVNPPGLGILFNLLKVKLRNMCHFPSCWAEIMKI